MMEAVKFKSVPENWEKEASGVKPNTIREVDLSDERFQILAGWMRRKEIVFVVERNRGGLFALFLARCDYILARL